MNGYKIGSKITVNDKEFEIMDIWEENESISEDDENSVTAAIYYANLKDKNGKMIGPIEIMMSKK